MLNDREPSKITVFQCECETEGIVVSPFDDPHPTDKNLVHREIYISLWSHGIRSGKRSMGIISKLRWMWAILRKGYPFLDEVILSTSTAADLGRELLAQSAEVD